MILITLFCQPDERLVYLFSLDEPRSRSATLTADKIPYQRTRGRPRTSSIHDLLEQQIRASHVSLPAIHAPKYSRGTYRGVGGHRGCTESGVPLRVDQVRGSAEGTPSQEFCRRCTKSGVLWGWTKSGGLLRVDQVRGSLGVDQVRGTAEGVLSQGFSEGVPSQEFYRGCANSGVLWGWT